jgi:hypothetical protein
MNDKLRKVLISTLLAGLATIVPTAPALANRSNPTPPNTGYVPPPKYGQDPEPFAAEDPYGAAPGDSTVVPVVLPEVVTDPGTDVLGDNEGRLGPADPTPAAAPSENGSTGGQVAGGILSRTGAETVPLARAGLAAIALGVGLFLLARRRRVDGASA